MKMLLFDRIVYVGCSTVHVINARAIDVSRRANIWSPNNTVLIENINYHRVVRYWVILNWRHQLTIYMSKSYSIILLRTRYPRIRWILITFDLYFLYTNEYFIAEKLWIVISYFTRSFQLYAIANSSTNGVLPADLFVIM